MPQNYTVSFSANNAPFTALTNVQSININLGREQQLNAYNAGTATIVIRYPTGFASPINDLVIGTRILIENATTGNKLVEGVINNVEISYGIPFANNVGPADYLTINVIGAFAAFARIQGKAFAMPADNLFDQLVLCNAETGLAASVVNADPLMPATTINGTWGDYINDVCLTLNSRLLEFFAANAISIRSPFALLTSTVNFSDVSNNATNQVYDQINFGRHADNFYTQVTVAPESFSAATVQTGAAPFKALKIDTLNASAGQATDYANYLLNNYKNATFGLFSISCLAEAQTTFKLDEISDNEYIALYPGYAVEVAFRGTVFNSIIEGVAFTATPESSRYTFYLSARDMNSYLILNDAIYGKLDENKLGY